MMCRDFQSRISAYLEGDQNEAVRRLMETHAGVCPGCAEALHGVRGMQVRLNQLPRTRLSPDFNFALRGKLLMEAGQSRGLGERVRAWLFPTFPRTALAGALALTLLAGLVLTTFRRPSPQETAQVAEPGVSSRAEDIPSHYVLERIPASPRSGVAISSSAYKNRSDSLSAPRGVRAASVQYVRF